MIKMEKNIVVDAPVEEVFAYLVDPARMPEYSQHELQDVERLPDGRYIYKSGAKFLGVHIDARTEQIEVVPNERFVEKTESPVMDLVMTLNFEQLKSGKTLVSVDSEYTFPGGGALAKFGESFFAKYLNHNAEMTMEAAKAQIEAKVLAATPS